MKKVVLAATAAVALTGSAFAADIAVKSRAPAPAPVYRAASWTGLYIGVGGGYGMYNQDNTTVTNPGGVAFDVLHTDGGRGYFGTVQVGADYQFNQKFLAGVFGDYDFAALKGNITTPTNAAVAPNNMSSAWAVGGRLGYLPYDTLLTYVSGGYTQARFDGGAFSTAGGLTGNSYGSQTYSGWFLGSGFEYKLDFFPGLFWKNEYRFSDYGTQTLISVPVGAGFATTSHAYAQTVRSELVWRFWAR